MRFGVEVPEDTLQNHLQKGAVSIRAYLRSITRLFFQLVFIFTPIWGRFPIWLIFFRWVETTNQIKIPCNFFADVASQGRSPQISKSFLKKLKRPPIPELTNTSNVWLGFLLNLCGRTGAFANRIPPCLCCKDVEGWWCQKRGNHCELNTSVFLVWCFGIDVLMFSDV